MVQLYRRQGAEILVNTATAGFQTNPQITRLSTGGYVVLWSDWSGVVGDPSGFDAKGQIFDAAGSKVGGEFLVNTATSGDQRVDSVATTSNGGFVVVYVSANQEIRAQIFGSSGARIGSELLVPAPNSGDRNSNASATVLADGTIVIAWERDPISSSSDDHIFARAFSASGAALGSEFRVDSSAARGAMPSVAGLASGGWVAIWVSYNGAAPGVVGQLFAANGAKVGGEFTVNSGGGSPVVAALAGGGFVVGWEDWDGGFDDGSYGGITAQIFADSGASLGPAFRVNTITRGNQEYFAIDELPGGGFVIAWTDESNLGGDPDSAGIMAQVFDSTGGKVGEQFLVNTLVEGRQALPAVAVLASGAFAVAWGSAPVDFDYPDIKTQLFTPYAGTATDIALSTASVSETSLGNYAVATLSDNGGVNSAKAYALLADSTGGGFRIDGNRLIAADNSRFDHETAPTASLTVRVTDSNGNSFDEVLSIAIADSAVEDRYTAQAEFAAGSGNVVYGKAGAIGALAGGGFVMTWVGNGDEAQYPGAGAIRGQLFDATGAKVGSEFLVNTTVIGHQQDPGAAGLQGGGFVVVWDDYSGLGGDTSDAGIKGQRFDSSGAKVGGEFQVNTLIQNGQADASVAGLPSGGFVVSWTNSDDYVSDISVQLFDSAGAKVGAEKVVNSASGFYVGNHWHSAVAALPNGGFVVTWTHSQVGQIMAQIFDAAGNKVGTDFLVASDSYYGQDNPAVAALASGGFVISWSDRNPQDGDTNGTGVKAQIFDSTGAKVGGRLLVNTATDGDQVLPTVTGLPWGGFVVSWQDGVGGGDDPSGAVRAQLFDAVGGRIGGDFVVNAGTDYDQAAPVSALLSSGGFVVGWQETYAEDGLSRYRFEGRVFSLTADNSGDDIITGDSGANLLDGGAGDDQVYGLGGNDDLRGGNDDDRLEGGEGNDRLRGDSGDDVLAGGAGDDDYEGGEGIDTLDFSGETDAVSVNLSSNSGLFSSSPLATRPLNPGEAFDSFGNYEAVSGIENLILTSGDDFVLGSDGDNRIEAGAGDDGVFGLGGNDLLLGGAGSDSLLGGGGDDWIEGGADDDELSGGDGDDRLDGGSGSDTALYNTAAAGVTVTLRLPGDAQNTGGAGVDRLTDIENLVGSDFGDTLIGNDYANVLDGRGGADTMRGSWGDDIYFVDNAGDVVDENAGEGVDQVRTALATYVLAANVENLTATSNAAHDFRGTSGNNVVAGGAGNDFIRFQDGGNDTGIGGLGNDVFLFGSTMDGLDAVDGGAGTDQVALQGGAAFTFGTGVVGVESIGLLAGSDTRFGDTAGNFYSYDLTTRDVNVAAGVVLTVDGAKLRSGENLIFNGSAETDGSFFIYGGRGVDTLTGGAKNDAFLFGSDGHFGSSDTVNGGAGIDQLALRGNYTLTFGAGQLVSIESLGLLSAQDTRYGALGTSYSYNLAMNDGNVAAGVQMTVDGAKLRGGETLVFNGSAETNGSFRIFGGANGDTIRGGQGNDVIQGNGGADQLTGGGGADIFVYKLVADSSGSAVDHILDFASGSDRIDLSKIDANTGLAGDQAFTWIGSSAFTGAAGQLRAYQSGSDWFVEGDTNGDGAADLVIQVTPADGPPSQSDFLP